MTDYKELMQKKYTHARNASAEKERSLSVDLTMKKREELKIARR